MTEHLQPLTVKEVADRAGVAVSSVSRVLSDHPDVSPAMRLRVMAIVEEFGCEPNMVASSLRRGSTMTVGFVVRDISSALFSEIVLGAETHLREHGYTMLLTNSEGSSELDVAHINLFRSRRVDGLLLSLSNEAHAGTLDEVRRLRAPYVLIDRELVDVPDASAVLCDHAGGMVEVANRLIDLGHRRIALIAGSPLVRPTRELERAFAETCARRSIDYIIETGAFSESHGEQAGERVLDSRERPTAILSGFSQILPGVLRAVRARGLRMPDDLSLVAFDELPMLEFVDPPISTVSRDALEIGREGARLLLRRLAGEPPANAHVATTFNDRGSCGPPP